MVRVNYTRFININFFPRTSRPLVVISMNLCFITIKSLKARKRLFKTFRTLTKYEKPMEDLKIQKSRKIQKKLVESLKEITINSRNDFNR